MKTLKSLFSKRTDPEESALRAVDKALPKHTAAPDETVAQVAKGIPGFKVTPDEKAAVLECEAAFLAAVAEERRHDHPAAAAHFHAQSERLAKSLASAETPTPVQSREAIAADFGAHRAAARAAQGAATARAVTIWIVVADRFLTGAQAAIDKLVIADIAQAKAFGFPYVPSELVRNLYGVVGRVEQERKKLLFKAGLALCVSPRAMFQMWGIFPFDERAEPEVTERIPAGDEAVSPQLVPPTPEEMKAKFAAKEQAKREAAARGDLVLGTNS